MKLNCGLLRTCDSSQAVKTVDIPADASVSDLLIAIRAVTPLPAGNSTMLQLYLATATAHSTTRSRAWLQRSKLLLLNASLIQQSCVRLDDPTQRLACDELFGPDVNSSGCDVNTIHVLVVASSGHSDHIKRPPQCASVFQESLQRGLMAFSRGSPGVFISLISFTMAHRKVSVEYDAWKNWFEAKAFAVYVEDNMRMFQPLSDEWQELTSSPWTDLTQALKKRNHASDPVSLRLQRVNCGEVKTRLKANAVDGRESQPPTDGHTRMCQRIRGWYLRIIMTCHQEANANASDGATE